MSKPKQDNEAACGGSALTAELGTDTPDRVGWWVIFDEPNDTGEIPEGFFINNERAKTFSAEPGFLKHHLEPVYRMYA